MLDIYISKNVIFKITSLSEEQEESNRILAKYNDRIPVIVSKDSNCKLPDLDKKKFLVPLDLILDGIFHNQEKRIKLSPEEAIFLFINNTLPRSTDTLKENYIMN